MPPDIPGMYYDAEKHRYMKIQPDHYARNLSSGVASKVSKSAVARQKEENARQASQATASVHIASCTVRRSNLLRHALGGARLGHELARARESPAKLRAGVWCQSLERTRCVEVDDLERESLSNVVRDPSTRALWVTVQRRGKSMLGYVHDSVDEEGSGPLRVQSLWWMFYEVITSLHIIPPNTICMTSLDGIVECFVMKADSLYPSSATTPTISFSGQTYHPPPNHPEETFWSSSLNTSSPIPSSSSFSTGTVLALATSHGISILTAYDFYHFCRINHIPARDVLCTAWTSPRVVLGGCRNGKLLLADTRVPDRLNSTVRVEHGISVRKVHAVDEWRILAAGPGKMALYDLRFSGAKVGLPGPLRGPKRTTKAYVEYAAYNNKKFLPGDLDVDAGLGIIATAREGQSGVEFLDLWSGKSLPSSQVWRVASPEDTMNWTWDTLIRGDGYEGQPSIVQFMREPSARNPGYGHGEDRRGGGDMPPGLVLGAGGVVNIWETGGRATPMNGDEAT